MLGAASVIVDDAARVLLVKHNYGEHNWELPGGRGEPGESIEETARREAREEVGIELEIVRLTGVYWEPEVPAHHFVFLARALGDPGSRISRRSTRLAGSRSRQCRGR